MFKIVKWKYMVLVYGNIFYDYGIIDVLIGWNKNDR